MTTEPTTNVQQKWYVKSSGSIVLLILFFPVGLYLMWKYSHFSKTLRIVITSFFALVVIANMNTEESDNSSTTQMQVTKTDQSENTVQTEPPPQDKPQEVAVPVEPQINIPSNQKAFVDVVESVKSEYDSAPNELKKSAVRTKRGKLIQKALNNSRNISGWVGIIADMQTNSEGKAIFAIKLESAGIELQTWNSAFQDAFDNTLISQDNKLYTVISDLNKGDRVIVNGSFSRSDESDFIKERSMTENGSMSDPEFIFKFTSVKKY